MKISLISIVTAALLASLTVHAERPSITSLQQQINVLSARVNSLEAQHTPLSVYDGNGNKIGLLLDFGGMNLPAFITSTGYFTHISINDQEGRPERAGDIFTEELFYEDTGCNGVPYGSQKTDWAVRQGVVFVGFDVDGSRSLYYANGVTETKTFLSISDENGCRNFDFPDGVASLAYQALHNDPSITGIYVKSFPIPITISE